VWLAIVVVLLRSHGKLNVRLVWWNCDGGIANATKSYMQKTAIAFLQLH
jgi:hypothetical protein